MLKATNKMNPYNVGAARFSKQPKPYGISQMNMNIYAGKMNNVDHTRDFKDEELRLKATRLVKDRRNNILSNMTRANMFSQPAPNLRNLYA